MNTWLRRFAASAVAIGGVALILASGTSGDSIKTWSKSFGGEHDDWISASLPTPDGGYLFVGNRDGTSSPFGSANAPSKLWIVKLDEFGDITWERGLADPTLAADDSDVQRSYSRVVAAADGGAWLVGKETSGASGDAIVVTRLDAAGQQLWTSGANGSRDFPIRYFYSDGRSSLQQPVAEPDAEGALWIAASSSAFAIDTRGGEADPNTGLDMTAIYLVRIGADGTVFAQRHVAVQPANLAFSPQRVRALADGGVAVAALKNGKDYLVVADAAGQLRSTTYIIDAATVGTGSRDRLTVNDFVPMRRNAIEGIDGDDGYVFAGNLIDQSFLARYFGNERDPDDPTEGSADQEVRPLENSWRIEISEITNIWAVVPNCGATPQVNRRCNVLVAGASREVPGALAIAGVDTDANISGFIRLVPDIAEVCQFRREIGLTSDGHAMFRLHARNRVGQSGSLVIDDQRLVIQPFVAHGGSSCGAGVSAGVAADGEIVALTSVASSNDAGERFNDLTVSRYGVDGAQRWQTTFGDTPRRWTRAMALGRDANGYVIAGSTGPTNGFEGHAAVLIRLDLEGALLWQRRIAEFTIEAGSEQSASSLAVQDGAYLLIGEDRDGTVHGMQFDGQGTLQWQRSLWGARGYGGGAASALRDGGWVIGGGGSDAQRAPLMRLGRNGESVWARGLQGVTQTDSIVENAAGNLYLGGLGRSGPVLVKLDGTGSVQWSKELHLAGGRSAAVRVGALPDGGVLVGTTTFGTRSEGVGDENGDGVIDEIDQDLREYNSADLLLLRFDTDGVEAPPQRIGGAYRDFLTSLSTTDEGGALIGAASLSLGSRHDRPEGWLLRLGPDGRTALSCAAELLPANYQPDRIVAGSVTGVAADAAEFAPATASSVRQVIGSTLGSTPLSPESQVVRHCSGSVRPQDGSREPTHHLRVIQGNASYSGVVTSVPGGILCGVGGGGTCGADFDADLLVTLRVDPASLARFESWEGCDTVDGPLCLVRMIDDRTVTATFAADPRSPTVNLNVEVAGRGEVTGTDGIHCRATTTGTCSSVFQRGSTAQLTATPDAGRSFLGWEGGCANFGVTRAITIVMNEGALCIARFSGPPPGAPQVTVSYRTFRGGNVVSTPAGIECGAANSLCSEGFAPGSDVTLDADATVAGWEFESFQCAGEPRQYGRSITLSQITENTECYADFNAGIERLHLRIVRDSNRASWLGRVYSTPTGLDCRNDCDRPFLRNETVLLRADPESGYYLSGWSGCTRVIPDSTNHLALSACEVRMDQRKDVVAFFGGIGPGPNTSRNLLVNFVPGSAPGLVTHHSGNIDCTPTDGDCLGDFTLGELVTLQIAPLGASTVASNSGCDTFTPASGSTPATCQLTMSADRVVTFGFLTPNNPPFASFTIEPANPVAGQPVTFDASASSDDYGIAGYRWSFLDNGTVNSTSSVVSTIYPVAGSFNARLTVTDAAGQSDEEVRTVVVSPAPTLVAPDITAQPQNVTVDVGQTASFSVNVIGSHPLSYRWQRNGADIPGETTDVYTTDPVTAADDGAVFRVIVSNSVGSETSAGAVLTVGHGWRRVGGSVETNGFPTQPSLAIDAAGTRYVSYVVGSGTGLALFVHRFDGTQWTMLGGGPVANDDDGSARDNALIVGADGAPIVAWNAGLRVRVARWNGTQWTMLADDLSIDTQDFYGTTGIQLVRSGNDLVAAWIETFGFPVGEIRVAVKRFDALTSTWSGAYVPDVYDAQKIRLALDAAGLPVIAYVPRTPGGVIDAIHVVRQTATGWEALGGGIGPVPVPNSTGLVANYGVDVRIDSTGAPVVIGSADGLNIFGFRHAGGAWQPMAGTDGVIVALDPATQSTALMSLAQSGSALALAYTRHQRPMGGGLQFISEFLQWTGTTWEPLGTPLQFLIYSMSPQLSGSPAMPQFAAEYRPPGGFSEIVVQQFVP